MDKREEIIEGAKKAFRHYGIFKTNLEDVGKECQMSKNALYYYFKNKEELFRAALHSEFETLLNEEQRKVAEIVDFKVFLRDFFIIRYNEAIRFISEYDLMRYESQQIYHHIFHEETEFLLDREQKILKDIIKNFISDDTDLESLVTLIVSINQGLLYKSLFSHQKSGNIEKEVNTIISFLFNGIKLKNPD